MTDNLFKGPVHPIYVSCHMCHASVGSPCRRLGSGEYHDRRASQAYRGPHWIDTIHALAHGSECDNDICNICGQKSDRLSKIPALLSEFRVVESSDGKDYSKLTVFTDGGGTTRTVAEFRKLSRRSRNGGPCALTLARQGVEQLLAEMYARKNEDSTS